MSYLKKFIKVLIFPAVFIVGEFFIKYIFVAIFNSNHLLKYRELYPDYNDIDIISTIEYKTELNKFLNNNALLIMIVIFIVFFLIFMNALKKYRNNSININNISIKDTLVLGIAVSILFNTFIYLLNGVVHITDSYKIGELPLIVTIIASGILGPILEELLFRGIVYNKLLEFNSHKKSIIITSILFSVMHTPNIITMIYTFFLSFIMIHLYDKYKTLIAPILFHIGINTTMNILIYILVKDNIIINTLLLLISLFGVAKIIVCNKKSSINS